MTAIEVRTEIEKVLDTVPENLLPEILSYVKQIQQQSPEQIRLENNLERIFLQDNELLQRLAQ